MNGKNVLIVDRLFFQAKRGPGWLDLVCTPPEQPFQLSTLSSMLDNTKATDTPLHEKHPIHLTKLDWTRFMTKGEVKPETQQHAQQVDVMPAVLITYYWTHTYSGWLLICDLCVIMYLPDNLCPGCNSWVLTFIVGLIPMMTEILQLLYDSATDWSLVGFFLTVVNIHHPNPHWVCRGNCFYSATNHIDIILNNICHSKTDCLMLVLFIDICQYLPVDQ